MNSARSRGENSRRRPISMLGISPRATSRARLLSLMLRRRAASRIGSNRGSSCDVTTSRMARLALHSLGIHASNLPSDVLHVRLAENPQVARACDGFELSADDDILDAMDRLTNAACDLPGR